MFGIEYGLDFSKALHALKLGETVSRVGWHNPNLSVHLQIPDANSKMTKPYLYMEKKLAGICAVERFPLDLSCESIMAEDWFIMAPNK